MKKSIVGLFGLLFVLSGYNAHALERSSSMDCTSDNSEAPELSINCAISQSFGPTSAVCSANGHRLEGARDGMEFSGHIDGKALQVSLDDGLTTGTARLGGYKYDCQ